MAPLVEMKDVSIAFGGIQAVDNVSITLNAGEVVGLLGHNGAGKSTLIKMLSGAYKMDSGEIWINGERAHIASPRDARDFNIETIYQTLALADNLDAASNLFLGRELTTSMGFVDDDRMEAETRKIMAKLNPNFRKLKEPVSALSGGQRQSVAIARAVYFGAKILILDEPTSALGVRQTSNVLATIDRVRKQGVGVVFISHNVRHALAVGDRFTVLNRGKTLGTATRGEITPEELQDMMAGGQEMAQLEGSLGGTV